MVIVLKGTKRLKSVCTDRGRDVFLFDPGAFCLAVKIAGIAIISYIVLIALCLRATLKNDNRTGHSKFGAPNDEWGFARHNIFSIALILEGQDHFILLE